MFSLTRPTAAVIEKQVAAASRLTVNGPRILSFRDGLRAGRLPFGYADDRSRTRLGQDQRAFEAARRALERWAAFDIGWVRVPNPAAKIALGQIVAVEARTLGLWSLNFCRIVEALDTGDRFGFVYSTTSIHVEQGDERFLIEYDRTTGDVWYELEAISRPRHALARLGYPVTRAFQRRFARDSHRRMREVVLAETAFLS